MKTITTISGVGSATFERLQHLLENGFVDDVYTEFLCFVEFAARLRAGEDVVGFFAHAAGDVTAERFDFFRGFFARH
jgi:hypothetical protein